MIPRSAWWGDFVWPFAFSAGYTSGCLCSPTHAGILTGRYQQRYGVDNITPWRPNDPSFALDLKEVPLANALNRLGYVSGQAGKWHLGVAEGVRPQDRGFKDSFCFMEADHDNFRTFDTWQNDLGLGREKSGLAGYLSQQRPR